MKQSSSIFGFSKLVSLNSIFSFLSFSSISQCGISWRCYHLYMKNITFKMLLSMLLCDCIDQYINNFVLSFAVQPGAESPGMPFKHVFSSWVHKGIWVCQCMRSAKGHLTRKNKWSSFSTDRQKQTRVLAGPGPRGGLQPPHSAPRFCWTENTEGHKQSWRFLEYIDDKFLSKRQKSQWGEVLCRTSYQQGISWEGSLGCSDSGGTQGPEGMEEGKKWVQFTWTSSE